MQTYGQLGAKRGGGHNARIAAKAALVKSNLAPRRKTIKGMARMGRSTGGACIVCGATGAASLSKHTPVAPTPHARLKGGVTSVGGRTPPRPAASSSRREPNAATLESAGCATRDGKCRGWRQGLGTRRHGSGGSTHGPWRYSSRPKATGHVKPRATMPVRRGRRRLTRPGRPTGSPLHQGEQAQRLDANAALRRR